MKKAIIILVFFTLFFGFGGIVYAQDLSKEYDLILDNIYDRQLIELLPQHTQQDLFELGLQQPNPTSLTKINFIKIKNYCTELVETQFKTPAKVLFQIIGVIVVLAVLESVKTTSEQSKNLTQVFQITSALVICTFIVKPLIDCISETSAVIVDCAEFVLSFLPIFTGLITACGQAGTATTTHVLLFWACQIASNFVSQFIIGLVGLYVAINVVGVAAPTLRIEGISSSIKTVITWTLGFTMTVFVGLLTLSSVVAAGSDNLGTRTARFFLGSFVPVVGGALSEAFATAQGCLRMVRSSVGAFGIIAAAVLFLPVVLRLICWYVTAGICSVLSNLFGLDSVAGLMKAMGTSIGILIALLLCFMLILLVAFTLVLLLGQGMG